MRRRSTAVPGFRTRQPPTISFCPLLRSPLPCSFSLRFASRLAYWRTLTLGLSTVGISRWWVSRARALSPRSVLLPTWTHGLSRTTRTYRGGLTSKPPRGPTPGEAASPDLHDQPKRIGQHFPFRSDRKCQAAFRSGLA